MSRRGELVDLDAERAALRPAGARFVLESRDCGSTTDEGRFLWSWRTEDNLDVEQFRPCQRHFGQMLRRVADRLDPRLPRVAARRHRVIASKR